MTYSDPGDQKIPDSTDPKQGGLFDAPPPPTGPKADVFTEADGRTPAFWRFFRSEDGRQFWATIQRDALSALDAGEKRFSPRGFLASYRDREKVRVNNIFSPWFADMLVLAHPELIDIIERRKRTKPGI